MLDLRREYLPSLYSLFMVLVPIKESGEEFFILQEVEEKLWHIILESLLLLAIIRVNLEDPVEESFFSKAVACALFQDRIHKFLEELSRADLLIFWLKFIQL